MFVLGVTGWYIHRPDVSPASMGTIRLLHFAFAAIFSANIILRVYYSFTKYGDWKNYLKPQINKTTLKLTYRHYLCYDHLPDGPQYRILQNASYLFVVIAFALQAITGILLFEAEGAAAKIVSSLGGLQMVRSTHLVLLWVFVIFTIAHVYMAVTEEFWKFKLMMFNIPNNEK